MGLLHITKTSHPQFNQGSSWSLNGEPSCTEQSQQMHAQVRDPAGMHDQILVSIYHMKKPFNQYADRDNITLNLSFPYSLRY